MNTHVSMLRGINVSGQKKIKMADLRALYESLGFENVRSYLQSGNVVFEDKNADASVLAAKIKSKIHDEYGYEVSIVMRDLAALQRVIASNPYLTDREEDPKMLYVTFLGEPPTKELADALERPDKCSDEFVLDGQEIFVFTPGGYGSTKLSNNFFERKLKISATTRNWKSVNALVEMASP